MEDNSNEGRCSDLRKEFQLNKFGLHHKRPSLFVNAQWFSPTVHLIWSVFWVLFFVTMFILDHTLYSSTQSDKWMIYLTNWTYALQSITVVLDCLVVVVVHWTRRDIRDGTSSDTPWYIKLLWVMVTVSNTASVLVTLLYYVLLEPTFSHPSINKHLLNSVYTLLNIFFCAKPMQLLHFYQPMIYATVYVIFSIIFHVGGGGAIYDPLDWSTVGNAALLSVLTLFIAVPIVHLFCFALYTLRLFIYSSCGCKQNSVEEKIQIRREITARDVNLREVVTSQADVSTVQTVAHASNIIRTGSQASNSLHISFTPSPS